MTDQKTIVTARKILPVLDGLVGAAAPGVRRKLNRLLAQVGKTGAAATAAKILELLMSYPAARKWMRAAAGHKPTAKGMGKPLAEAPATKTLIKTVPANLFVNTAIPRE